MWLGRNVDFNVGTININGTYNVTGTSSFTGATVNFNNTITSLGSGGLTISAGTANFGSNNLTLSTINQSGGTLDGTERSARQAFSPGVGHDERDRNN